MLEILEFDLQTSLANLKSGKHSHEFNYTEGCILNLSKLIDFCPSTQKNHQKTYGSLIISGEKEVI